MNWPRFIAFAPTKPTATTGPKVHIAFMPDSCQNTWVADRTSSCSRIQRLRHKDLKLSGFEICVGVHGRPHHTHSKSFAPLVLISWGMFKHMTQAMVHVFCASMSSFPEQCDTRPTARHKASRLLCWKVCWHASGRQHCVRRSLVA